MNIDNTSEMQASHRLALKIWPLDEILRIQEHSLVIMPITFPIFNWYEPGFVKVFASIGHPTSSTKTLTQRSSGHINKLQFLVGQKKGFERIETKPPQKTFCLQQKTLKQERPGTYRCWVALQVTIDLPQVQKIRLFNEACLCPSCIQDRGSMALEGWEKKKLRAGDIYFGKIYKVKCTNKG